jgi:hypothetical protein
MPDSDNDGQPQTITYEKWFAIGVGQMGLRPCDFEALTVAEFYYAYMGFSAQHYQQIRDTWERIRWQTWVLTSIQLERKDRKSMTEMFPMPWDNTAASPKGAQISMKERQERIKRIMECVNTQQ